MIRYRLRTLLILMAVVPPAIAVALQAFASLGPFRIYGWLCIAVTLFFAVGVLLTPVIDRLIESLNKQSGK